MAGPDLFISFGADTSGLEAAMASSKASVNAFTRELAALAREQIETGAAADSALGQKMVETARKLDQARNAAHELTQGQQNLGGSAEHLGGVVDTLKQRFEGVVSTLKQLAALAGVAFTANAFKDWIVTNTDAAEKLVDVAARTNLSFRELQTLSGMSQLMGGGPEALTSGIEQLQLELLKGENASAEFTGGLKAWASRRHS